MYKYIILSIILFASCSTEKQVNNLANRLVDPNSSISPTVVLMTDFGNTDAVATCHQAIKRMNRDIEIIDYNHNVSAFNIQQSSILLTRSKDFPNKSVFVAVVDPGVGTVRKSIILKVKNRDLYFVGPNNGIFSDVANDYGIEAIYEINVKKVNPHWSVGSFDGRDLYSPTGAILATLGEKSLEYIGTKLNNSEFVTFNIKNRVQVGQNSIDAEVVAIDEPYGNIWTQVTYYDLIKLGIKFDDKINISFNNKSIEIKLFKTFADVLIGQDLAYFDSRNGTVKYGFFALAVNQGNFKAKYNLKAGDRITIAKA